MVGIKMGPNRMVNFRRNLALILLPMIVTLSLPGNAQQDSAPTVFRVDTSLVLVDVIAENTKTALHTRELLTDLQREDFRVLDNGHEMPIRTFDTGALHSARPIALWLIVQCNMGFPVEWASTFVRGKTQMLAPALAHLNKGDMVGVAHWCDDGKYAIDLPAGHDSVAALAKVDELVNEGVHQGANRSGELAMQGMIRAVLQATRTIDPPRLPIFLFLYGDHSGTSPVEADAILEDLLENSCLVFGLNDNGYQVGPDHGPAGEFGSALSITTAGRLAAATTLHPIPSCFPTHSITS
jgi:hypothetical protein